MVLSDPEVKHNLATARRETQIKSPTVRLLDLIRDPNLGKYLLHGISF
jgi:hypothetical protein